MQGSPETGSVPALWILCPVVLLISQVSLALRQNYLLALAWGLDECPKLVWSALTHSLCPGAITQEGAGEENYKSSIELSMKAVGKFYSLQYLLLTVVARQHSPCLGIPQVWPVSGVFCFHIINSLSESQSTLACAPSAHISLVLQWHNFSRWLIRPIINSSPSLECGMLCKLTDSKPQKVLTQLWLCFCTVSVGQWCSINLYHCQQS